MLPSTTQFALVTVLDTVNALDTKELSPPILLNVISNSPMSNFLRSQVPPLETIFSNFYSFT